MSPTVSIVLPTYNRAHLLPSVLETILSQDYEDFDLVIVDDGSTDNTLEVISEFQARDSRLRYIRLPENRGPGFARDEGLNRAVAKYIALADSDDLWVPGRLKEQVEILDQHPEIEILFGDYLNIDHVHESRNTGFSLSAVGMQALILRRLSDDLWIIERGLEKAILRSNFIGTPTMLLRKEVFARVGGFDHMLQTSEDLEFHWRAATLGAQYAFINKPLIERHVHRDSLTAQGVTPLIQRLEALRKCHALSRSIDCPELLTSIRSAELRTCRNLIFRYGEQKQRVNACRVYIGSLRYGFSARTLFSLILALLGPRAIRLALRASLARSNFEASRIRLRI